MTHRLAGLLFGLLGAAPSLSAQRVFYEGGLSVAKGNYIFADPTTSWSLSTGVAIEAGQLTLRLGWPMYVQNTTLVSIEAPAGGMPTGGSSSGVVADSGAARNRREGGSGGGMMPSFSMKGGPVEVPASATTGYAAAVGDPIGQILWQPVASRTSVAASIMIKAPVADTTTFGTGQWDVGASVSVAPSLTDRVLASVELAAWHMGDLGTLDFQDPIYGTVALSYLWSPALLLGVSATASTTAMAGYEGPAWVGAHLTRASGGTAWGLSGTIGLSETAPGVTVGLFWRMRLFGSS